jgi:dihydrofolate reductase
VTRLIVDISTSLDGFVAGPDATLEQPLGEGGERLHEWVVGLASFRERHGMSGGGESKPDDEVVQEVTDAVGAYIMGRRMFSGGSGPWQDDPNADAWWGDEPPFRAPVFVLTRHPRETVTKQGGTSFTFVTDGIEAALEQARAASGGKAVQVSGGADVVQQYLRAGLVDELQLHVSPVLLGAGTRLLDGLAGVRAELEIDRVVASPAVTHLRYRVVN